MPNPPLQRGGCGLGVVVLVDASSSIFMAGAENPDLMRAGAVTLLQALRGTASTAAVISFRNNAVTELPPTSLEDGAGFRRAVQAVDGIDFDRGTFGDPAAGTNWDAAFRAARTRGTNAEGATDLVVILTDGNPNRYGQPVDDRPRPTTPDFDPRALDAGVAEADDLRRAGTRVVAVGVGDVRAPSLQAVSGPVRGEDWFVGDFSAVADAVGAVATDVCGRRVAVEARVDGAPLSGVSFSLDAGSGGPSRRRTNPEGTASFIVPPGANQTTLTGAPTQGAAELATIDCTRNDRPFDASVDLGRGEVVLPTTDSGVVACGYGYELNPALAGPGARRGDPLPASPACDRYRDEGTALTPASTIRLYDGLRRTICEEALRFAISELLLAVTIQHEGYNRSKLVQGRIDKWIENQFTIPLPFLGKNDTVGLAQMRPNLALRLARRYLDGFEDVSEDAVRRMLVYDSAFAVRMAAAYLSELQREAALTDRQTFITYAFGAELIEELRRRDFAGTEAVRRGRRYDQLAREILDRGEGFG